MKRGLVIAMALLSMWSAAAAQQTSSRWIGEVQESASAAAIHYFDRDDPNASTTTYADRQEVGNWSIFNSGTGAVTVHIYTKAHVTGEPTLGQDFVALEMGGGESREVSGVVLIGWRIVDAPSGGDVKVMGWNR